MGVQVPELIEEWAFYDKIAFAISINSEQYTLAVETINISRCVWESIPSVVKSRLWTS